MSVDWGSIPAWIALVIGATTAIVAVVNYRRSVADKQREQASRVTSWISVEKISVERLSQAEDADEGDRYQLSGSPVLHIVNRSDAPVYHLHVRWKQPVDLSTPFDKNEQRGQIPDGSRVVEELPAGQEDRKDLDRWFFYQDLGPGMEFDENGKPSVEPSVTVLTFTDALGRRWKRTGAGPVKKWQTWWNPPPSSPRAYIPFK